MSTVSSTHASAMSNMDQTLALHQLDSLDSPLHQQLLAALDDLTLGLSRLVRDVEGREDQELLRTQVWEAVDSHNYVMSGLQMFRASLDGEAASLEQKLEILNKKKEDLLDERDELIEKGHELNCRIGYNALERKLEETFTDTEKYTTLSSAKCFREEAEEEHRRTNDLIRIGNMRACQIDRDLYNEMEKITDLFENYERDREHYVRELDLFCDVRRTRLSGWLAEDVRTEEEREKGEDMLDYLSLTEKRRHMEAQLIKSALRMYSFNASLTFDREDNQKLLDELTSVQNEVNAVSGLNVVLPRQAIARTDLSLEVQECVFGGVRSGQDVTDHEPSGRGLHRCPRKFDLATDPITDVSLIARLDDALRWEERDGEDSTGCDAVGSSLSDVMDAGRTDTSSPSSQESVKVVGAVCGDHQQNVNTEDKFIEDAETAPREAELRDKERHQTETGTEWAEPDSTHNFLQSIESVHAVPPPTVERHMVGVVRKKKSSLTNFSHSDAANSGHRIAAADSQERLTRSQGSEPVSRPAAGGNKSRDAGSDAISRSIIGGHKLKEETRTRSSGSIVTRVTKEDLTKDTKVAKEENTKDKDY